MSDLHWWPLSVENKEVDLCAVKKGRRISKRAKNNFYHFKYVLYIFKNVSTVWLIKSKPTWQLWQVYILWLFNFLSYVSSSSTIPISSSCITQAFRTTYRGLWRLANFLVWPSLNIVSRKVKSALPLVTVLSDYLADWTMAVCTWSEREILVPGGWHPSGCEGWVWQEEGQVSGKTFLLSLMDTSTGPCRCIDLH